MLSDHERKTLREVERQFMLEDPDFARSFEAAEQRSPHEHHRMIVKISIVVAVLLSALMLAIESLSGALAFAAATGVIWVVWRHSDDTSGRAT